MIFEALAFSIALIVLAKSSSITIEKAVKLSQLSGINQIAVGFIFIAVATSLPELSIAIISSLQGEGILSVGNLVGANITNIALIIGLASLVGFNLGKIFSARIEQAVIATAVIAFFMLVLGKISLVFGIFCVVLFYLFLSSVMKDGFVVGNGNDKIKILEKLKAAIYLLLAVSVVVISAFVVTDSAVKLSRILGIAESLIGATVVAMGTTLPELSVGIAAIRKRNISILVGDLVGSLVTNLTLILGIVAVINPLAIDKGIFAALASFIAISLVFLLLSYRMKFGFREGFILLSLYTIYLIVMFNLDLIL